MPLTSEELLNPKFPHKFGRFIRRWKNDLPILHIWRMEPVYQNYFQTQPASRTYNTRRFVKSNFIPAGLWDRNEVKANFQGDLPDWFI